MIDFRSDTVTKPCNTMKQAMFDAQLGDDVYGDDPSVNELEQWVAETHGFESAIFCSSGTQANLLALMSHCERGDEYLCGQQAHNYKFEGGGAAVLGSIQPQPVENEKDGTLCFKKLKSYIKPIDPHFAKTKLLSLENTINGKILPLAYLTQAREFANENSLQLHLDGARVYNAKVALDIDIMKIAQHFDSMTICLSKGLGAPIGSLLLGTNELIAKARRWRKVLGGGMRQVGILAAAAKTALTENVEKLKQDHANALHLAKSLCGIKGVSINPEHVQTNMVFFKLDKPALIHSIAQELKAKDILISPANPVRLVTHLDITKQDVDVFIKELKSALSKSTL
ncbi:low-specificity L-threonine aldolase [Pseudoalteromonas sp. NBT06-2]|uniref:low-specificity L-threonine aldolase n=1 Tax=Pseudoalteromonas sp. NBT06-2 TaxID=2025950 RepID=UPI000BA5F0C1|nr:low-specificity L-threonine aldolase [Pseudoalteromonas sp. NBT06-2]PAJ74237.1 low-specificity L-threonine aldolase [Pseudoalteromonas sp. NBT06-2]